MEYSLAQHVKDLGFSLKHCKDRESKREGDRGRKERRKKERRKMLKNHAEHSR